MPEYLLSVHSCEDVVREPMTPEQMQAAMAGINALEAEMKATGAWMFSGRLTEASTATVVRMEGSDVLTTDGPFVESKEHLGGFYIVSAPDLDAALSWAAKTTACIGEPIEVRPFFGLQAG